MNIEKRPLPSNILLILLVPVVGMALGVTVTLLLDIDPVYSNLIINLCFLTAVVLLIPIFKPFRAELGLQIIPAQMGRHGVMALLALGLYLLLAQYGFQGATKISTSEGKSALPRFREL